MPEIKSKKEYFNYQCISSQACIRQDQIFQEWGEIYGLFEMGEQGNSWKFTKRTNKIKIDMRNTTFNQVFENIRNQNTGHFTTWIVKLTIFVQKQFC